MGAAVAREVARAWRRAPLVPLLAAIALGGCSDDAPPGGVTCLASASISGDLRPRWDQTFGTGSTGVMRVRRDGTLVLSGESDTLGPSVRTRVLVATEQQPAPTPFIMALSRDGKTLWTRRLSWPFFAHDLDVDAAGNTYFIGTAGQMATVDLGKGPITGSAFVAKLDPDGRTVFSFPITHSALSDWGSGSEMHLAAGPRGEIAIFGSAGSKASVNWYDATSGGYLGTQIAVGGVAVPGPIAFDAAGGLIVTGLIGGAEGPESVPWGWREAPFSAQSGAFAVYFDREQKGVWAHAFGEQTTATALAVGGTRAFLAGTFSGTLAVEGGDAQAHGATGFMIVTIDDLASAGPRFVARTVVSAGEGDRIEALAPNGSGGVVALATVQHHLSFGGLLLAPTAEAIVDLDEGGLPVAHAVFPSANTDLRGASVVRDAHGTYVFGSFRGAISLGGDRFQAAAVDRGWPGLFLAAFGPQPTLAKSVGCPLPAGALADFPRAGGPIRVALAGETIVVATETALSAVPAEGGESRRLAIGQSKISSLAAWGDRIVWSRSSTMLPEGTGEVAIDVRDDGSVMVVSAAGGTPTVLASGQAPTRALATDGAAVYWTASGQRRYGTSVVLAGSLLSVPVAGGSPTVLASGYAWVGPVAVGGGYVVFAGGTTSTQGRIVRVPTTGGTAVDIAFIDQFVTSLATDGDTAFWTNTSDFGPTTVWRAPLAGGPTTAFAPDRSNPRDVTVVEAQLYWLEGYSGFGGPVLPDDMPTIRSTPADGRGSIVDVERANTLGAFAIDSRRLTWLSYKDNDWLLRVKRRVPF